MARQSVERWLSSEEPDETGRYVYRETEEELLPEDCVVRAAAFRFYKKWCARHGKKPLGKYTFYEELRDLLGTEETIIRGGDRVFPQLAVDQRVDSKQQEREWEAEIQRLAADPTTDESFLDNRIRSFQATFKRDPDLTPTQN